MIILTDCLTHKTDEGCLKVANSLVKRMKKYAPETQVVSFGKRSDQGDVHLKLNKAFLNPSLFRTIRKRNEPVLYIPFSSNTAMSVVRTWVLARMSGKGVKVLFALRHPMSRLSGFLLRKTKAQVIVLSEDSCDYYRSLGMDTVCLRAGIDISQFTPADAETKKALREKYHVIPGKKVFLHVGHLKNGRNIEKLLDVGPDYHVFLVASTVTKCSESEALHRKLMQRPNTTIVDSYLEHVEELYQMADVYFFPVQEMENCIDTPLSVMEAAACNVPVVTTKYGELNAFADCPGFRFLDRLDKQSINQALDEMSALQNCRNREAVASYDWDMAAQRLLQL